MNDKNMNESHKILKRYTAVCITVILAASAAAGASVCIERGNYGLNGDEPEIISDGDGIFCK